MKTLVFLLLVLPPSWSTQRLGQKDSDLDAELELVDGGVHSHEDPYTSAARVKTSDDVDKGYIPLCYTEPTDSKYTLECANGEFAQRWNGCIELGSQRVRCPKYHHPCNNIRPNGKEFYCSVTCKGDTFGGKRNDCIEGYIPLCYAEATDSKYTLECANGEFAERWDGCIELGSQRVRCPKYHHPCNNIRPNGKEFHCSVDCISDTHGGKRTDCIKGYFETPWIDLDALTSWGKWGEVEKCSYPHFVNRMEIKYERRDIFQDDTALNAIRLTCTDGRTISSSEGHWGRFWRSSTCPEGKFINKARIRSEAITAGDNTAANGIRFECTDGSEHNPFDGFWGSWRPFKSCQPGSAIYGIQTLVKAPFKGDDTALNNVKFFCAKLPESGKV